MTLALCKQRVFAVGVLVTLGIAMAMPMSFVSAILSNEGHANSNHVEAMEIRELMNKRGGCTPPISPPFMGVKYWFSEVNGTMLTLCRMSESSIAGRVVRITTAGGFLNEKCYECTVFMADRNYWGWVLKRDTYTPAPPNVTDMYRSTIRG